MIIVKNHEELNKLNLAYNTSMGFHADFGKNLIVVYAETLQFDKFFLVLRFRSDI